MVATLVVGGTGAVGRHLVPLLAAQGRRVLVASRTLRTATEVADGIVGGAPAALDTSADELVLPADVELVVDCSGTNQTAVAIAGARVGADLIDISASSAHLEAVTELQSLFADSGGRCMIGVGLAPGLSTMLAASIHDPADSLPISIHGLLDTRDEHGPGSAAFTLGKLDTDFTALARTQEFEYSGELRATTLRRA